ncbi:MAG: hypothetical protein HOP19_20985 [Acidobacteria bacterium]|nr:hypothetical protein [Acidobacteriota bacterium]
MTYLPSQLMFKTENLLKAWPQVCAQLPDLPLIAQAIASYEDDLRGNLHALRTRLLRGTYHPARQGASITALLEDFVVQRAVGNVLEVLLTASPPGAVSSRQAAIERLQQAQARGFRGVILSELPGYPHQLNCELLLQRIATQFADEPLLALLTLWCETGALFGEPPEVHHETTGHIHQLTRAWLTNFLQTGRWTMGQPADLNDEQFVAQVMASFTTTRTSETSREELRRAAWNRLVRAAAATGAALLVLYAASRWLRRRTWPGSLTALSAVAGLLGAYVLRQPQTSPVTTGIPLVLETQKRLETLLADLLVRDFDLALTQAGWPLVRIGGSFAIPVSNAQSAQAALQLAQQVLGRMGEELESDRTSLVRFEDAQELISNHWVV